MNVREAVEDAMRQVFPSFTGPVPNELSAADVPGWDSFAHVRLMFEIESRLGCEIDVTQTYEFQDVGELMIHLAGLKHG
jgi:acyl carrier protein